MMMKKMLWVMYLLMTAQCMVTRGNQIVTGIARIVSTSNQLHKVCKGDIVVASMTESSWESTLRFAGGIITDRGNSHCHAALFGKKMGIPVIVGAGNATTKIIDGQQVTIDSLKNSFYCGSVVAHIVTVPHYGITSTSGINAAFDNGLSSFDSFFLGSSISNNVVYKKNHQQSSSFNITKERIRQDRSEIVRYMNDVSRDINKGIFYGKTAAYYIAGIESDVFDSMPVHFFENLSTMSKIDEQFNQLDINDDVIDYIQEGIEKIGKQRGKPVHQNLLGRISYRRL